MHFVNLVTQNKRIFENKKSEYTFRTLNSLIKSLKKAFDNTKNINFHITVIDAGSTENDKSIMRKILDKSDIKFNFIDLNLNDYLKRIKIINKNNPQIENNMKSTMASIIKSFEISKNANDLVYFVEDDYIHSIDCISEMISAYEKFSTILEDEIFTSVDYLIYIKKINLQVYL